MLGLFIDPGLYTLTQDGLPYIVGKLGDMLNICRSVTGQLWSDFLVYPHGNIHEINTWKCPIQTQCG